VLSDAKAIDCSYKRVLIANRGAIAARIIRTLSEMGIESIAVFAEADRQSLHVRRANFACSLGEGAAADTYLNGARILEIARDYHVDAIHPGYGFLSENSQFVRECEASNIGFIGPTSEQIEAFGLKHRARELADAHDVPLLPGTQVLSDSDDAISSAQAIGYPVMLKSSAGGGGIGMQLCFDQVQLADSFNRVSELSLNNFGNADLFLEKYIEKARHIEVQIFGDGNGAVVALGERDCSAQRRNQKVLEETPAPNLSDATRLSLRDVACRLAAAVQYRNAGTVEFIVDADTEHHYFLEVNTRLQVEHGVTELVYGIDIVRWMVQLSAGNNPIPEKSPPVRGHAVQARVYAEDPARNFQPSAGLLSQVSLPAAGTGRRIDHWIESGISVSSYYDPMLAKVMALADNREKALQRLDDQLGEFSVYGIETNIDYLRQLLNHHAIRDGLCLTSTLKSIQYKVRSVDVLRAGTMTTIQDYPGRIGYWPVGIPPSGPFDDYHFRLGNRLVGNRSNDAGLEMTLDGVTLGFNLDTTIALTGAIMPAKLDSLPVSFGCAIRVSKGQTLTLGAISGAGMRSYLSIKGGIDCPLYLGSRATFTLGNFGGHAGRALRTGDVLRVNPETLEDNVDVLEAGALTPLPLTPEPSAPEQKAPKQFEIQKHWRVHVVTGPHGTEEFFTQAYLEEFYQAEWSVHFNSSRTGVRLVGPPPKWAREDGGEAGMHPSNLHDNAYAFGTIDFTGDMPVMLGPDGPSLGGFVCPATVASADRWKLGQLKPGDTLQFIAVSYASAVLQLDAQNAAIESLSPLPDHWEPADTLEPLIVSFPIEDSQNGDTVSVTIRRAGDCWLLIEIGEMTLDIALRFVVERLIAVLQCEAIDGIIELTPGVRSLQIHYDCLVQSESSLIEKVSLYCQSLLKEDQATIPSRIVHLPLSWDNEQCQIAIEKYDQVVRKDAPWYPSNIEFIRRINGLDSIEDVKKIVFDAQYLVLGLGDVYLGAPVATPLDPRHRLVTTKYNPARTWTAENSVGIGGSYLCIYGMEGPGGYQFVGRTLQIWNIYKETTEFTKPWLLRYFDRIKFYPVSSEELQSIRRDFPHGDHSIKIEHTEFDLQEYRHFLQENRESINTFARSRQAAFDTELQHWKETGQYQFEESTASPDRDDTVLDASQSAIESPASGSVWKILVTQGDDVDPGQTVLILESMKMEINVTSAVSGTVEEILYPTGSIVEAGKQLVILKNKNL